MSSELALTVGLLGLGYMLLKTSEVLEDEELSLQTGVYAIGWLFLVLMQYGGWGVAQNQSLPMFETAYLVSFVTSIVLYVSFLGWIGWGMYTDFQDKEEEWGWD